MLNKKHEKILGWLPKTSSIACANNQSKSIWRRPIWLAIILITLVGLSIVTFLGANALICYTDNNGITPTYFERTINCTSMPKIGDELEVQVSVYWPGCASDRFVQQVDIVDSYSESNFQLVSGNNGLQNSGYGCCGHFTYVLKVIGDDVGSLYVSFPQLYIDGTEVSVIGGRLHCVDSALV